MEAMQVLLQAGKARHYPTILIAARSFGAAVMPFVGEKWARLKIPV